MSLSSSRFVHQNTYQDTSSVTSQVTSYKSRSNLLLWYSADEPDGSQDTVNVTSVAYNTITSIDVYHPVSLVLNCQDYQFQTYGTGADVILQDTFMIGNNVTWSNEWNTPCTPHYGDCGCDNCKGVFEDITIRMDEYAQRMEILGWEMEKVLWAVPQGFGQEQYWLRYPTGPKFILQSIIAINHGAMGTVSWSDPTAAEIKSFASLLARALPSITPFLFNPNVTFTRYSSPNRIDIGAWTDAGKTLVMAANMNYANMTLDLRGVPGVPEGGWHVTPVLNSIGAILQGTMIVFQSVGSGAYTNVGRYLASNKVWNWPL